MLTIYEGIILFRNLPKDELAVSVKRVAGFILDGGGVLRKLLYMGQRRAPQRQSKNKIPHWEAHYLFYEFNAPKIQLPAIASQLVRDADVIKHTLVTMRMDHDSRRTNAMVANPQIDFDACTFDEENRIVPERPHVIKLVERAQQIQKKKTRKIVPLNTNIDFHPFENTVKP